MLSPDGTDEILQVVGTKRIDLLAPSSEIGHTSVSGMGIVVDCDRTPPRYPDDENFLTNTMFGFCCDFIGGNALIFRCKDGVGSWLMSEEADEIVEAATALAAQRIPQEDDDDEV